MSSGSGTGRIQAPQAVSGRSALVLSDWADDPPNVPCTDLQLYADEVDTWFRVSLSGR